MRWPIRRYAALMALLLMAALAACGGGSGAQPESAGTPQETENNVQPAAPPAAPGPTTLRFYNSSMTEAAFQAAYLDPIAAKFPQFTIEVLTQQDKLDELVVSGKVPDLLLGGGTPFAATLKQLDIPDNVEPLIKKYNYDFGKVHPAIAPTIKGYFGSEHLLAMPAGRTNYFLIYYNLDLFDRFAVPYPKDNMTWDELLDVSRAMTRNEDGVQYRGFTFQNTVMTRFNPLSLSYIDPGTQKAAVNNEGWKRYFDTMRKFYEIPGNLNAESLGNIGKNIDELLKDRTLAMLLVGQIVSRMPEPEKAGFRWDVTSMPDFTGKGTGLQLDFPFLVISKTSKHKEEAFQAILAVLEMEALIRNAKDGVLSISTDPEIHRDFGVNNPSLQGKNLKAMTGYNAAQPQAYFSEYDAIAIGALTNGLWEAIKDDIDTNTILRTMEERINKSIEEQKAR